MEIYSISNVKFKLYKTQLINLGFRHKEAKILLKYIIKYYNNILSNNSIHFADIYYYYKYFFKYEEKDDSFSELVYKILNKWVNNNYNNADHDEYYYLYDKLCLFGDYIPWARIYADIDSVHISSILSLYYHKKETETNDILIFKEIVDTNSYMFCNKNHGIYFFEKIEELFRTKINWNIFLTAHSINNQLPQELIEHIYKFLLL